LWSRVYVATIGDMVRHDLKEVPTHAAQLRNRGPSWAATALADKAVLALRERC
jgi:hypothetical protein